MSKKKVVVIGGGNGSAKGVLALKPYVKDLELSAVVSMSDSGGSSGKLRKKFGILPPGDILRAVLAMSKYEYQTLKAIFHKNRIKESGHSLGNLVLKELSGEGKDMVKAVRLLEQAVEAQGRVYPSTVTLTDLVVELDNGEVIKGEAEIDRPSYNRKLRIKKAWLDPHGEVYPDAAKVIEEADYIALAPGSLYTSLIAALLPSGLKEAIEKSSAKIITVISKSYEVKGETGPTSVVGYLRELHQYLPHRSDFVLYNNSELDEAKIKLNKDAGWTLLYNLDEAELVEYNFIRADLERDEGFAIDPEKLGKELMKIINGN